jgi:hypothetical protein
MKFKIGDRVKVLVNVTVGEDDYIHLVPGVVTTIAGVWESEEFPYELDGYTEQVREDELELTEEDLTEHGA